MTGIGGVNPRAGTGESPARGRAPWQRAVSTRRGCRADVLETHINLMCGVLKWSKGV